MKFNKYIVAYSLFISTILLGTLAFFEIRSSHQINTKRIEQKIAKYTADSDLALVYFLRSKNFSDNNYRFNIYKNEKLIKWSNSDAYFDFPTLNNVAVGTVVQNKYGSFLLVKKEFDLHRNRVFGLLVLSKKFPIKNDFIESKLNQNIFKNISGDIIFEPKNNAVKIELPHNNLLYISNLNTIEDSYYSFYYLFLLALLLSVYYVVIRLFAKLRVEYRFVLQALILIIARGLQIVLTATILSEERTNVKFASSFYNSSFYDIYLNFILLGLIAWLINKERKEWIKVFDHIVRKTGELLIVAAIIIFFLLLDVFYFNLINNSFIDFSIDSILNFSFEHISFQALLALGSFYLVAFLFFYNYFLFVRKKERKITKNWLLASAVLCTVLFIIDTFWYGLNSIFAIKAILIFGLLYLVKSKALYILNFRTYLFFIVFISISALLFSFHYVRLNENKENLSRQALVDELLQNQDILGEALLDNLNQSLKEDPFIQQKLTDPFGAKQFIQNKIEKYYLHEYFNKYDVKVNVLNKLDIQFENSNDSLYLHFNSEKINLKKTSYDNLYIEIKNEADPFIHYIKIIDLDDFKYQNANILIDLKLREVLPNSVIPYLVLDNQYISEDFEGKSYAMVRDNKVVYSYGEFNYESIKNELFKLRHQSDLFQKSIKKNDYYHYIYKLGDTFVLISYQNNFIENYTVNFAFHFLILLVFFYLGFVSFILLRNYEQKFSGVSLTTKFQLIVNLIILLPMISIATILINYEKEDKQKRFEAEFIEKAKSVELFFKYEKIMRYNRQQLSEKLHECAQQNKVDINIYSPDGIFNASSQPLLYENNIIGKLINPNYFNKSGESNEFVLNENVGKMQFKSVYVTLKNEKNQRQAIISIPFYTSGKYIEKDLLIFIKRIIFVFIVVFFFMIIISYLISNAITKPLTILSGRLNSVDIEKNEPIKWTSNDELGVLVRNYNSMILKLEESKKRLSKQEKENAWKEMAQQVAHEIKNPLTPMRLSLQILQRKSDEKEKIDALIEQVDKLKDIANSFSSFAKLPEAKFETVELNKMLKSCVEVHKDAISIVLNTESESFFANIDHKLMSGVITNLILNGVQAVQNHKPEIRISLFKKGKNAVISVKDNGEGIPESIKDKVFLPNFSTKYHGSGIGLALAKKTVEEAGGKIYFETIEGEGTTFYIELPLIKQ